MSRSIKKGPFVDVHLLDKVAKAAATNDRRPIKTWSRRSMILPDMVGLRSPCTTAGSTFPAGFENMVGHKLGEFARPARSRVIRATARSPRHRSAPGAGRRPGCTGRRRVAAASRRAARSKGHVMKSSPTSLRAHLAAEMSPRRGSNSRPVRVERSEDSRFQPQVCCPHDAQGARVGHCERRAQSRRGYRRAQGRQHPRSTAHRSSLVTPRVPKAAAIAS